MPPDVEREAKFAVADDFEVPNLAPFIADQPVTKRLDAIYVDTEDLLLARRHITLRYRTDSSGTEAAGWTLKLPQAVARFLSRAEHYFAGTEGAVPPDVQRLVGGLVGKRPLGPIAHLVTQRTERTVRDGTERLATLADDHVTSGDHSFRELELELVGAIAPERLQPLRKLLTAAGARPATSRSKLHTVIGAKATLPPVPAVVKVDKRSSVQDLLRNVIGGSTRRLIDQSLALRMNGGEPETIHQARVATRRLRSDLRTFRRLLDPAWVASLRDELRWLAGPLGEVRDLDVMIDRLDPVVESMAANDRPHGHALLAGLRTQRQEAMARLTAELDDPRFVTLIDRLLDGSEAPPVTDDANGKAAVAVLPIVKHPWRRLRTAVKELDDPPTDQALHALRIDAKRLRYALEAAQPVLGKSARRQAKAVADLQGVLGDLHDTVVARDRLQALGDSYADPRAALVVGTLIGWEHAQHEALRAQWEAKWEKASAKKLRRWMR